MTFPLQQYHIPSLSLLHLLAIYKLQCLIFGPRDLFLPPRRGSSGLVVFHQEMRTSHFARLPLAVLPAAAGPFPLAGICDVVEVINTACGQREGAGVKEKLPTDPRESTF